MVRDSGRLKLQRLMFGQCPAHDNALVLKYRPDFIASARLLRDKVVNFDRLCAPVSTTAPNGVEMPKPVLANKVACDNKATGGKGLANVSCA